VEGTRVPCPGRSGQLARARTLCGVRAQLDHDAFDAAQVLRAGVVVEAHAIADVEHRKRLGGVDRLQQLAPSVDRVGDRGQMRVKLAGGDLIEE
jgi:hypothetical protein